MAKVKLSQTSLRSASTANGQQILVETSGDGTDDTALFTARGRRDLNDTFDGTGRGGTIVSRDIFDTVGHRIPGNFHKGTTKQSREDSIPLTTTGAWRMNVTFISPWHIRVRR